MKCVCDVIMLTWNQLETTKVCIESYFKNTIVSTRLIVIDNDSDDSTRIYLSSLKDTVNCKVQVIFNKENLGFVRGMNQGIEISDAPYVCLANNDLIFTKGWLKEIIDVFDKYKNLGVLNPNSNNLGDTPRKDISLESFGDKLKEKKQGVFIEMPYCIGFCMVIRKQVIEKIGGLSDEFYPMFFEDTDYSLKANKAGYLIGMAKASYVVHNEHSSTGKIGKKKEEIFCKSKQTFIKKWGKMLRIAWVIKEEQFIGCVLKEAVELARNGNFIWIFVKNLKGKTEEIFSKNNFIEHSGIKFLKYKSILELMWKLLKKKKNYDIIMNSNKRVNNIFAKFGHKTLESLNKEEINKVKMS
ncbi:MAG: glycosyltransferase family 2 protein [Candidatus Omnitrophica bacterium]|nr:glycosyltransferase family 2 protein [Candidatus Omnitrophota bacterium]